MDSSAGCLSESIVFNGLDPQEIDNLAPLFLRRTIMPGDVLAQQGQLTQFFFLLEKGTLLVAMEAGKAVVLNRPGDFAGLSILSSGISSGASLNRTNTATVTVLEKGVVWAVPSLNILDLIDQDTEVSAIISQGWQEFLVQTAPFCSNFAKTSVA